jgi:hypothetical protein
MRVELADVRLISFPPVCACCGEAPEVTQPVGESKTLRGRIRTRLWRIPYCRRCVEHRALMWPGIFALLIFMTVGLFAVPYVLILRPRRHVRAEALRKPGCSDVRGVTYSHPSTFDPATHTLAYHHVFDHASEPFARALLTANSGGG